MMHLQRAGGGEEYQKENTVIRPGLTTWKK